MNRHPKRRDCWWERSSTPFYKAVARPPAPRERKSGDPGKQRLGLCLADLQLDRADLGLRPESGRVKERLEPGLNRFRQRLLTDCPWEDRARAEPLVQAVRRLDVTSAVSGLFAVIGAAVTLASCTGAPAGDLTGQTAQPVCRAGELSVAVAGADVRVTNVTKTACAFSGRYPVELDVWHLAGPRPPIARGTLRPGASYVQPYQALSGNGCGGLQSDGVLTVHVEGSVVKVTVPRETAREVRTCTAFSAGKPYIQ